MQNLGLWSNVGLEELPEDCISLILSFTTPLDAARLALVSHKWRSAADSDALWKKMLPNHYYQILQRAITPVPDFPSMKQLYLHLCQSILIDNGSKRIWVDRTTGKVGCMVSARDLCVIWGDDSRYWNWVSREDSRFESLAELNYVWWFEVKGGFECNLLSPNTRYRVSFVVKIDESRMSIPFRTPFIFSVDSVNGDHMESGRYLDELERAVENRTPLIRAGNGWMEFVAGEFFLEEDEAIPREIGFCMKNTDNSIKTGIWIDGVRIEPLS